MGCGNKICIHCISQGWKRKGESGSDFHLSIEEHNLIHPKPDIGLSFGRSEHNTLIIITLVSGPANIALICEMNKENCFIKIISKNYFSYLSVSLRNPLAFKDPLFFIKLLINKLCVNKKSCARQKLEKDR